MLFMCCVCFSGRRVAEFDISHGPGSATQQTETDPSGRVRALQSPDALPQVSIIAHSLHAIALF